MNNNYLTRFSGIKSKLQQLQTSPFSKIWVMTIWGGLRRGQRSFRLNFCSLDEKCCCLDLCHTGSCSPVSQSEVWGSNPVWSREAVFPQLQNSRLQLLRFSLLFILHTAILTFDFHVVIIQLDICFVWYFIRRLIYNADFSTENSNIVEVERVCVLLYPFERVCRQHLGTRIQWLWFEPITCKPTHAFTW